MSSSLGYHKDTSYARNSMDGHAMDWQNQPRLHKRYPSELAKVLLPTTEKYNQSSLWKPFEKIKASDLPGLDMLSTILDLTQTFTAKSRQPSGDFYFRSAASAGALYPNEIYVCAHKVENLGQGTYYYDVFQKSLIQLRNESSQHVFSDITLNSTQNYPAATFLVTAIFNRSSWKYRKRAYRYVLLDAGHVLQNLLFALNSLNITFSYGYDFIDHQINHLLGLDEKKEVCLAWVNVSDHFQIPEQKDTGSLKDLPPAIKAASLTATVETAYPQILDIHQDGNFKSPQDITIPDRVTESFSLGLLWENPQKIIQSPSGSKALPYPEALFSRRSKRNFVPDEIPFDKLMHLLTLLDTQSRLNTRESPYPSSISAGFLADKVTGIDSGIYLCDFARSHYGMVESGVFQILMAAICLEQSWLKNAGLHFLFMANLEEVDKQWGARGYRYSMMEAGRLGQALYAGATAIGLGCCGIGALFDHEARQLLSLNESSFLVYLVAVGATKS